MTVPVPVPSPSSRPWTLDASLPSSSSDLGSLSDLPAPIPAKKLAPLKGRASPLPPVMVSSDSSNDSGIKRSIIAPRAIKRDNQLTAVSSDDDDDDDGNEEKRKEMRRRRELRRASGKAVQRPAPSPAAVVISSDSSDSDPVQ